MKFVYRFLVVASVLLVGLSAFGQTTANLTGRVVLDGNGLPGVTVTAASPNLQGVRTTVTDVNGNYNFGALPPGEYTVKFEMESMQTISRTARIGVAQTGRVDAEMRLTAMAEAITVTAAAPAVLETTEVQTNIQARTVEDLPIGRTLIATTTLAPGVNSNGPNVGSITISGALAADNLFLVNGAVTNENLRGQPHNLFIEDAIQETTVQTAGISAEYGRFTGGVVSAITKSGGNEFSGSLRDSVVNDAWTEEGPLQTAESLDELLETYEGTLGGRIVRDRLWFFAAGRFFTQDRGANFTSSSLPYITGREEMRMEGKLTGQITAKHNVVLSYLDITDDQTNNCFISCFEESNLDTARSTPNDFMVLRYNGILTDQLLLEASYTQKNFAFIESGGNDRDRITGTWGYDGGSTGGFFGAPVFCGVCDPEERNNSTYGLKATYYLASKSLGTHNIVTGYENWSEVRLSNNYQSGSNYGISVYSAEPERGANGQVLPIIAPGDTIGYFPIAQLSKGSDFVTDSIYVNDKWDLNSRWQFNLGFRFDKNDGKDSQGVTRANDSLISPRLGAMFDIFGNGRLRANASYSKYVNRIAETIGGGASAAGNPAGIYYEYQGPEISGVPTFEAFRRAFAWFDSVGGLSNTGLIVRASIPGVNTQINDSLVSPNVDEFTLGLGTQIGQNGYIRADYIDRDWKDFFITRTDQGTGSVEDSFGNVFDLQLLENTDLLERTYKAVQLQGAYRLMQRFNLGANYTWSETKGNQTGQTSGSGPVADSTSGPAFYPEFKTFANFNPVGFLPQDQTHKVRAWVSYDMPTPIGRFNFSVLQRFDSGTSYSAIGTIDSRPFVAASVLAAYVTPPASVNYFFSDRGEFRFDDVTATDLAINYNLPISRLELFVQGELINSFNEDAQTGGNAAVLTARSSQCQQLANGPTPGARCIAFNPFTTAPVEGTHYRFGPTFGQATTPTTAAAQGSFQLPRTYRVSLGLRF